MASAAQQSAEAEPAEKKKHTASGREALGFCKGLNKRLMMPTPPRASSLMGWKEVRGEGGRMIMCHMLFLLFMLFRAGRCWGFAWVLAPQTTF